MEDFVDVCQNCSAERIESKPKMDIGEYLNQNPCPFRPLFSKFLSFSLKNREHLTELL